jgi:hypothetical protein
LKLHEQGVGLGGEGVLAKLMAEEKETRGEYPEDARWR